MKYTYPLGATPLEPDEAADLIPSHITTQAELNEWEQANILDAELWLDKMNVQGINFGNFTFGNANFAGDISIYLGKCLSIEFIKQLHKKMFNKTWRWAGSFRKSDKNIGVDWIYISVRLQALLDDVKYQVINRSYSIDEIAIRLHHRLVFIHPFPNGNGRHSRCFTDLFLKLCGAPRFSWGQQNLTESSKIRDQYINALRAADKHDYTDLLKFARNV